MGELGDAIARKQLQDEQARLRKLELQARELEAMQHGAELAREFIEEADRMGVKPDTILYHVTFYFREHPSIVKPSEATRDRDKDISRVPVAECWSIYGYLLTTDGLHAEPVRRRSEVRKRPFRSQWYSIGEDDWSMVPVLSTETVNTNPASEREVPLVDAMAQYLDSQIGQ